MCQSIQSHEVGYRYPDLWEHPFQGRPRVNPTVKRGIEENTLFIRTPPADTGNRTNLYDSTAVNVHTHARTHSVKHNMPLSSRDARLHRAMT